MLPLLPVGVGVLAFCAWWASGRNSNNGTAKSSVAGEGATFGGMTPERQIIYQTALACAKDPDELNKLASTFQAQGLYAQAQLLRKRANLRSLPKEVKEERAKIFKLGMNCKDPEQVLSLASAFESEGATGVANRLREYGNALKEAQKSDKAA